MLYCSRGELLGVTSSNFSILQYRQRFPMLQQCGPVSPHLRLLQVQRFSSYVDNFLSIIILQIYSEVYPWTYASRIFDQWSTTIGLYTFLKCTCQSGPSRVDIETASPTIAYLMCPSRMSYELLVFVESTSFSLLLYR